MTAEAARGDLLDRRVALVSVPPGILAALASVGLGPETIERDGNGLVSLGRECAVRHRPARETADDALGRLHLVDGNRRAGDDRLEQVSGLQWRPARYESRELLVCVPAVLGDLDAISVLHGSVQRVRLVELVQLVQRVDDLAARRVWFSTLAPLVVAGVLELWLARGGRCHSLANLTVELVESNTTDRARRAGEGGVGDLGGRAR